MKNLRSTSRRPECFSTSLLSTANRPSRSIGNSTSACRADHGWEPAARGPASVVTRAGAKNQRVAQYGGERVPAARSRGLCSGPARVSDLCRRGAQSIGAASNRGTERREGSVVQTRAEMISQPMNFFGLAHRRSLQPGLADVTHFRSSRFGASSRIDFRRAAITYSATSTLQATHPSNWRLRVISPRRGACAASRTRW